MAISRLQASLAQATNEVTLAAANINFDFTLFRCEAPQEFQVLGNSLSKKRKDEAEVGQLHITARRLGALFEGVCPKTPRLIKAYGSRASEIATYASKHYSEPTGSVFAEYSGIDGTSIWAAATSSPSAIHVQLLACMLARIWPAEQAISVWFELVKERRKEIASRYENGDAVHYGLLAAACQDNISRNHLAEWDASARAWLRTADEIRRRDQQQLRLILENINLYVNNDSIVFSSTLAAWKTALEAMEGLIGGASQATSPGPTILALTSWHLYPDLIAFGDKEVVVKFRDPLIPAGSRITVGLSSGHGEDRGIHWSLSLAHLTFYGKPIKSDGQYDEASARLTFHQFTIAIFGTIMGVWNLKFDDLTALATVLVGLDASFTKTVQNEEHTDSNRPEYPDYKTYKQKAISGAEKNPVSRLIHDRLHWWRLLISAADSILEAKGDDKKEIYQLVRLGMRRSRKFFPVGDTKPESLFGLCSPPILVRLIKSDPLRIAFLRSMAMQGENITEEEASKSPLLIRIHNFGPQYTTVFPLGNDQEHHRWLSNPVYQATEEPWTQIYESRIHTGGYLSSFLDPDKGRTFHFQSVYGHSDTISICQDLDRKLQSIAPPDLNTLTQCVRNDQLDPEDVIDHLLHFETTDLVGRTLRALSNIGMLYRSIPNATINVKVLDKSLLETAWISKINKWSTAGGYPAFTAELDRQTAFSCIAYLEACIDIAPSDLELVFALAYEDSFYITTQLVCDPCEQAVSFEMRRVFGNVGKPGLTLLIPPTTQMTSSVDPASWRLASTNSFNGLPEDHFRSTSLHLSFTEYYVPAYVKGRQTQDNKVFYLEAFVSIYDSGRWIGDINVLKALESNQISYQAVSCDRKEQHATPNSVRSDFESSELISVESWNDILDPPLESFVVRAHGNWVARLAVLSMLIQNAKKTDRQNVIVYHSGSCLSCDKSLMRLGHSKRRLDYGYIYYDSADRQLDWHHVKGGGHMMGMLQLSDVLDHVLLTRRREVNCVKVTVHPDLTGRVLHSDQEAQSNKKK